MRILVSLEGKYLAHVSQGFKDDKPTESKRKTKEYNFFLCASRKTRALIIDGIGDRPLRALQSAESPIETGIFLYERYVSKTYNNSIQLLNSLVNKRLTFSMDFCDHVSEIESLFNLITAIERKLDDQMKASMLKVSVSDAPRLPSVVADIETLKCEKETWNFVCTLLTEESRTIQPKSL